MAKMPALSCSTLLLPLLFVSVVGCGKVPAGTVASDGVVEVRYVTGRIGKAMFVSGTSKQLTDKDVLQIQIWIENLTGSTKLQYQGWGGDGLSTGHKAKLMDELGNQYKPVTFGVLHKPIGQKSKESLYPGSAIQDVLVFEVPVDKAQMMHLTLPRGSYLPSVDGSQNLELAIPTSTFNGGGL